MGLGPGPGPAIPSPYCLRHWESKKELGLGLGLGPGPAPWALSALAFRRGKKALGLLLGTGPMCPNPYCLRPWQNKEASGLPQVWAWARAWSLRPFPLGRQGREEGIVSGLGGWSWAYGPEILLSMPSARKETLGLAPGLVLGPGSKALGPFCTRKRKGKRRRTQTSFLWDSSFACILRCFAAFGARTPVT